MVDIFPNLNFFCSTVFGGDEIDIAVLVHIGHIETVRRVLDNHGMEFPIGILCLVRPLPPIDAVL